MLDRACCRKSSTANSVGPAQLSSGARAQLQDRAQVLHGVHGRTSNLNPMPSPNRSNTVLWAHRERRLAMVNQRSGRLPAS